MNKNMNVYEEKEIEEEVDIYTIGMYDEDLAEEMADSMPCDLYGMCAGTSCRNWINCHN